MSWEEVGKINSDYTREPLNFNNYINDISTFGKYSYVLDPENSKLWRDLICRSLVMFGHDAIHDTVYERLTDADVDYMLRHNTRLGQAFNSFYSVSDFTSGRIDSVLSAITAASYNVLDLKFQSGINRYVSEKTSGNTAGEWLGTVFGIASLKSKTTMASIISDTTLWNNTVAVNESLRFVICLSVSAAEYMASHSNSSNYVSFIETVAHSTDATMTLINALAATSQLETFFANESVCNAVTRSEPSMIAICYNLDAFASFINSPVAMTYVQDSDIAQNVIVNAISSVGEQEIKMNIVHSSLDTINTNIESIQEWDAVISKIETTNREIDDCLTSIYSVLDNADILVENMSSKLVDQTKKIDANVVTNRVIAIKTSGLTDFQNSIFNRTLNDTTVATSTVLQSNIEAYMNNIEECKDFLKSNGYVTEYYYSSTPIGGRGTRTFTVEASESDKVLLYTGWTAFNGGNKRDFIASCTITIEIGGLTGKYQRSYRDNNITDIAVHPIIIKAGEICTITLNYSNYTGSHCGNFVYLTMSK